MLNITANNITLKAELTVTKGILLEAKQNLVVTDTLSSEIIECNSVSFKSSGKIRSETSLILKSEVINLSGRIQSKVLIINSGSLYSGTNSKIIIEEHSMLIADSAKLKGRLEFGSQLFCKIRNVHIASPLKALNEAYFDCNSFKISEQGGIEFILLKEPSANVLRQIKARKIILLKGAHVKLDHVNLSASSIYSMAKLEINNCHLDVETLNLEGACSTNNSKFFIENTVTLNGDTTSLFLNTKFEAETVNFAGQNNCHEVEFISDNFVISSFNNSRITASRFDVSNVMLLEEKSRTIWENCQIYTDSIQFRGEVSLKNCEVESATCLTSEQTILHATTIEARIFWQDEGAIISNCSVITESTSLLNKTSIENTKITTNSFSYTSSGKLTNCIVEVSKALSGSNIGNLTFKQCLLRTEQTYTQGILNFTDNSNYQTNYLQQSTGEINVDNSNVENTSLLFSMKNARFSAKNNAIIKVKNALFNGASDWNSSSFAAIGPVIFCGIVTGEKATIESQKSIYLTKNNHAFNHSQINSEEQVIVTGSLILSAESDINCHTFNVSSKNTLIENSKITAHDLNILDKFCAKKTAIVLQSTLKLYNGSSVEIEDGPITAINMSFSGFLKIARSELKAVKNIIFDKISKSNLQVVKLEAGNDIEFTQGSDVTGKGVETKSNHLENAGKLKIDDLSVNAMTIHNSNAIKSDDSVQLKANLGMLNNGFISASNVKIQATSLGNAFGQIHSVKNSTIQAPLIVNYMGDISGSGTVSMDSLQHFNLLGTERAYDYNSRTLYDYSYGFKLPNLPHSLNDVFTVSRVLSMLKMGITQLLSTYGNLISLGFMAAPYVKDATRLASNFCRSDDKFRDLPAKIYDASVSSIQDFKKKFKISETADYLPVMLEAMNTILTINQLSNTVAGAWYELNPKTLSPSVTGSVQNSEASVTSNTEVVVENNIKTPVINVGIKAIEFVADIGIKTFGPSMTTQSFISQTNGVALSVNMMDSNYYDEVNDGIKSGWNFVGNYKAGVNRGIFAGVNMVVTGKSYENYGSFSSLNKTSLLFADYFANAEDAELKLNGFHIKTDKFTNAAKLDLNEGTVEVNNFIQTQTGKAQFVKTSAIISEEALLNGDYAFIAQSTVVVKNLTLSDKGLINQSTIIVEDKLTQTGCLISNESLISGTNVFLNGLEATDGRIIAKNDLEIKNANTLSTGLAAKNAHLSDSTFLGRKSEETTIETQSSDTPAIESKIAGGANKIAVQDKLITENVRIEGMQVETGFHTDSCSTFRESVLNSSTDFFGCDSKFDHTSLHASDINFNGTTDIKSSHVNAKNDLKQEGAIKTEDSILKAKNIAINGLTAVDGKIIAENQLDIKNANTLGTALAASNANLADSTFEGRISEEPENDTEAEKSEIETKTENAESDPSGAVGNQIKIDNELNTSNVVMKNLQVKSNTHNDIDGSYSKTQVVAGKDFTGKNTRLHKSALLARNATLLGQSVVNFSQVIAQEKLTQNGNLIGKEAYLIGENIKLDGIKLTKSTVIAENKLIIKNANTIDTGISGKDVDLRDSKFKSSQPAKETTEPDPAIETVETEGSDPHKHIDTTKKPTEELGSNQINASEKLYTNNVEMADQSIQAIRMEAKSTKMQSTHVKIKKDFIAEDLKTDKSYIDTNTAGFRGVVSMKDTVTKADDSIVFENNSILKTHNTEYISKNNIIHKSKNHKQTGSLVFDSKNVKTTETSNIRSGSDSSFYVKAKTGNFKGAMHLEEGYFDVEKLAHAEDLIGKRGQSSKQTFTKSLTVKTEQAIDIKNMKPRDCDVAVICDAITVTSDYKSTKDVTFIATEGKVIVNADISGSKVALQSEKSNVEVNGKTVLGTTYVHVDAKRDIIVTANEKSYKGKYDIEKTYSQGNIIGGSGNAETEGAGVIIHAANKVLIDASNVCADGKVIVSGDKGVDIKSRTHTSITEKWSKNKKCLGVRHGRKKYERIDTQVSHSTFGSTNDRVQIISSKGAVNGVGADFIAKNGTDIYSEKDIKLQSIITQTQVRKENSSGFGLNSKKSKNNYQNAKLVDFVDDGGKTRLYSNTGDVKGTDVRFRGKGDLKFSAPQGTVDFKSRKLNHSSKKSERKFSLSSPPVQSAKQFMSDDRKKFVKQVEPSLNHVEALINAKKPLDLAVSTLNTAVNGYNTLSAIQSGSYGQQLMQGAGFIPKINLTLTETKSSSHSQTGTGAGFFTEGSISFESKNEVNLEGVPIEGKNLYIKTKKILVRGQAFESSHKMKTRSATVGISPTGDVTDASFSQSSSKMNGKKYQNMGINIKNEITIEADSMVMDAAYMESDTIKVELNSLIIQSRQDELNVQTQSVNASTSGTVGVQQSNTDSKQVNQISGIHVRSNIAEDDIRIKKVNLIGAAITCDGHNDFVPEKLHTTTLKDYSQTQGFGFSGNINSIANALDNAPSSRLTTVSISYEKRDYQANVEATVYGKDGVSDNLVKQNPQLNTSSALAKTVTRDTAHKIVVDVPVEIVKSSIQTGLKFFENTIKPKNIPTPPIDLEKFAEPIFSDSISIKDEIIAITQAEEASDKTRILDEIEMSTELPSEQEESDTQVMGSQLKKENSVDDLSDGTDELNDDNDDVEEGRKTRTFNPRPKTKTVGLKQSRNQQRLYNKSNGQYTNVKKEMAASAEDSMMTGNIDLVLISGGDKQDGLYYQAKIDPQSQQLTIEAGAGQQYCYNLANCSSELEFLGEMSFAIDACSATALIKTQAQLTSSTVSATASGELGIMGPSITGSYTTPCFSFMGLTLQFTGQACLGIGVKVVSGVSAEADAQKMKAGVVGKIGFFEGVGVQASLKTEVGLDVKYLKAHHQACLEFQEDNYTMEIIEKMKNYQPLSSWERDYFNDKMDEVSDKALFNSWFGPK